MTRLAVVGVGLVTPVAPSAREHAFALRAGPPSDATGPAFIDAEGERIAVAHVPWLDPAMPVAERLASLAADALAEALGCAAVWADTPRPLGDGMDLDAMARRRAREMGVRVDLTTAAPRPGFVDDNRAACEAALLDLAGGRSATRRTGAAGVFAALVDAADRIGKGADRALAIVAVDSFVSLDAVAAHVARPAPPWTREPPRPAEGAAAILVTSEAEAKKQRLPVLAIVHAAATRRAGATDDDDEPVDGSAMTSLLRELPRPAPFAHAFGPHVVDALRMREWDYAAARNASAFAPEVRLDCVETQTGSVGAAAGGVYAAYAIAMLAHRTPPFEPGGGDAARPGPAVAWAIGREGTRGVCLVTAGA